MALDPASIPPTTQIGSPGVANETSSATGGYLLPAPGGSQSIDIIQIAVVGITGLPASLVRPRWQPVPPPQPTVETNWCAVGVVRRSIDDFPFIGHDPANGGTDTMQRHETYELLASFYGPAGNENAAILRDGLYLPQNMEVLGSHGFKLLEAGDVVTAPDLVHMQWIYRADITIRLRHQTNRVYRVLSLISAPFVPIGRP